MYGMSAKERLAVMQQKGAKAQEPGKGVGGIPKPVPGKLNGGPGPLKKPETPAVDPKKPATPQPAKPQEPVKPKEEPKPAAAPEPAKPAAAPAPAKPAAAPEPAKAAAAPEPAKPAAAPAPAKPAAAPEPAKAAAAPAPAKPAAAPESAKPAAAPQPAKPAAAPEPAKPAAAPAPAKPAAAPEPAKPAAAPAPAKAAAAPEPAKPAAAPQPAKPATAPEPAKPAAAPQPAKPKEEPKKPAAAPEPAKPAAAPAPAKPAAAPEPAKPAAAPAPAKPKEEPKKPEPAKAVEPPKEPGKPATTKPSDDFFRGIFYFSGMGTLVGSALAEGVYVPEKAQRSAVDSDEIEAANERQRLRRGEEIIATARTQAQGLSTDFRHLQALLESLPTFTEVLEPQPLDRRAVDEVIHGHVYFQQEQHPAPFQTRAGHQGAEHPPPHHPLAAELQPQSHHQAPAARRPAGGVSVLPATFDQKHSVVTAGEGPGSFAAAIDEFDRISATAQQPVYGAQPGAARESPRPHRRERPTGDASSAAAAAAAAAAEAEKAAGGARPYGVHTGQAEPAPGSAWQDRYGQAEVAKFQAPRPFSATEIDSKGVKSWQLSHLRTLEAKGYQIVESEGDAVKSYAPYLVSDRSHGVDRQRALHPNFDAIAPRSPAFKSPSAPAQSSAFAPDDLPYCDL